MRSLPMNIMSFIEMNIGYSKATKYLLDGQSNKYAILNCIFTNPDLVNFTFGKMPYYSPANNANYF
jgi:hypothetical protein